MQISKKIPFDDPNVLNAVRALYVVSNLIIAGIYFYVQQQINKKNGACSAAHMWRLSRSPHDCAHDLRANIAL
jgi:hypothetical protein